ncbi:hypothetical protein BGT96224_4393 [Blumeria graminis f. sp. tritici 96224]|uniref:Bgt-4393 n=2 Tax=Blumeria graminis f. sp. tritici TaxID=62690 RepID=A0A061HLB1_BLUGR|nr:hypothetical protein BGT96224_4393 [Blumeria graminis f. sp. tritici 96224]
MNKNHDESRRPPPHHEILCGSAKDSPPLYQDLPSAPINAEAALNIRSWSLPPKLAWSSHNLSHSEIRTLAPHYSNNADALYGMIIEQASYPPSYYVQIHGKHNETQQSGAKQTKEEITDFFFRINISHLLGPLGSGELISLPNNKRGYRGTRIPRLVPGLDDLESRDAVFEWCQRYVDDAAKVKSFTLSREVLNFDTNKLYQLIRSAITDTNYCGQVYITFPSTHCKLIVYSPCRVNAWRVNAWVRWFCYLSFLWVFIWPILIFLTSRYEIVKSVFYYADSPYSDDPNRACQVMSEHEWFRMWQSSIKRAVSTKVNTGDDGVLPEEYRTTTERLLTHSLETNNPSENIIGNRPDTRPFNSRFVSNNERWGNDS